MMQKIRASLHDLQKKIFNTKECLLFVILTYLCAQLFPKKLFCYG